MSTNGPLPSGTVTFLFADIEGSTSLWERFPEPMKTAIARHDDLLRAAVEGCAGKVVKTTGDGCYAVFDTAAAAALAAITAQRALAQAWPEGGDLVLRSRIGLNTGEAELRDDDYHGTALNRAARLMAASHGGQILLSAITADLLEGMLPEGAEIRDLGEHRLRGLSRLQRLYQLVAPGLRADFPPPVTQGDAASVLPTPSTSFVGRAPEVRQVIGLLNDPTIRLLTLVGPGGTGKTRLAIQAAGEVAAHGPGRFSDGVYFVPLAPLCSADSMVTAVASSVGLRFRPEEPPRQQLLDYLRRKNLLLVMDNAEHLLDAGGAELPADIIENSPGVGILVTTRTRLNVQGEHLFPVAGMRTPEVRTARRWRERGLDLEREAASYSAIQLFIQCATRIRPGFRLTADNVIDVVRICRQVQGMPLGIELAAAWLDALSLPEIAAEISRCLDILATDQRGVPDRQRSIRAVFESSWALLTPQERAVLPALSVFRGSFTREAAGSVSGASLRVLLGLVNKSWLQPAGRGPEGAQAASGLSAPVPARRFQTHALLRAYAEEKLAEDPEREREAKERLAAYYARLLDELLPALIGLEQSAAFDAVAAEYEDIRSAWEWLVDQGDFVTIVDKMLAPLYIYANSRFLGAEVAPLLDSALSRFQASTPPGDPAQDLMLAKLLAARAGIYLMYYTGEFSPGDINTAWALANALGPDRLGVWYILLNQVYAFSGGRLQALGNILARVEAHRAAEVSGRAPGLSTPEGAMFTFERALARQTAARLLLDEFATEDDLGQAEALVREAIDLYEALGDRDACAGAYGDQADIEARRRHWDGALELVNRVQQLGETVGNWGGVWRSLLFRRELYLQSGEPQRMFPVFDEMLELSRDVGNYRLELWTLGWDSIYSLRYYGTERALEKRLGAKAIADEFAIPYEQAWSAWELGEVYRVMGDAGNARLWFDRSRPLFERINASLGVGFYQRGLGVLALGRNDYAAAYDHFRRYLDAALAEGLVWSQVYALCGMGRSAASLDRCAEAVGHYREALRLASGSERHDLVGLPLAHLADLAQRQDSPATALAIAAQVLASPLTWMETRAWVETTVEEARARLPEDETAAAEALGRGYDVDALVARLLEADTDHETWLSVSLSA